MSAFDFTINRVGRELYRADGRLLAIWDPHLKKWSTTTAIPQAIRDHLAAQSEDLDVRDLKRWLEDLYQGPPGTPRA